MKRFSCLLLLIIFFCAIAFLGQWILNELRSHTEAVFGPVSPEIGITQELLLSWKLYQSEMALTMPADPFGNDVPFKIELGESPTSVSMRLEADEVILNAQSFRDFLIYSGLDTKIQAGNYVLNPKLPAIQIADSILDATPTEVPFAVLAGWRIEEIAESLPNSGLNIPPDVFIREAHNQNLEGYLLPGIYPIPRTINTAALLKILTEEFNNAVTPELVAGFEAQGLAVDEAVRLASIIEREAIDEDEKPLIGSVFMNRLAIGMKLEADPTVQYAVGYNVDQDTWWTNPLSVSDLQTNSPYNTYINYGLPPGAICNPSIESLKAVAFSAKTPYYYFRATCDNSGKHNFSETFDEHLGYECP